MRPANLGEIPFLIDTTLLPSLSKGFFSVLPNALHQSYISLNTKARCNGFFSQPFLQLFSHELCHLNGWGIKPFLQQLFFQVFPSVI